VAKTSEDVEKETPQIYKLFIQIIKSQTKAMRGLSYYNASNDISNVYLLQL